MQGTVLKGRSISKVENLCFMELDDDIMHRKPWLACTERTPILEEIFVVTEEHP